MKKEIDARDIAWFGPIWRRIALIAVLVIWCAVEFYNQNQFWGVMILAVMAYGVWKLFIDFPSAADIAAWREEQAKATEAAAEEPESD